MFWETLWALVLGFTLSGAVQAFVSRGEMQRAMGDHRPRTIVRTSLLGAASSSCSYAASALAKSLFQRGADFTTAMVFMFASTNLVRRARHRAVAADGLAVRARRVRRRRHHDRAVRAARPADLPARRARAGPRAAWTPRAPDGAAGHGDADSADDEQARPFRARLRSRAGWADAAGYTVSDLSMLRRELVIGYLVAGFLAVAVPATVYSTVFLSGHGAAPTLRTSSSGRSSRSSASSARSGTSRLPRRCTRAGSASGAPWRSSSPTSSPCRWS